MDRWLLSFFTGAILSLFLPIVPAIFYVNLFTGIAVCCICLKNTRCLAFFFLGASVVIAHATYYQNAWQNHFKPLTQPQSVTLTGKVIQVTSDLLIQPKSGRYPADSEQRFVMSVSSINAVPVKQALNIKLVWSDASQWVFAGQRWRLSVRVKPAFGLANQGSFSYQTWLRVKQIHGTGYVKSKGENSLLLDNITLRQKWIQRYAALMPKQKESALILALAFGERQSLSPEQWQLLQQSGTSHLLAISGMHLSLVAMGGFLLLLLCCRAIVACIYYLRLSKCAWLNGVLLNDVLSKVLDQNIVRTSTIALIFLVSLYAYMANFSLPTVRALIMISLLVIAKAFHVRITLTRIILLTLFIVIFLMPESIYSMSFWLSFYAVILIGGLVWRFGHIPHKAELSGYGRVYWRMMQMVKIQALLSLFMLPVVLLIAQSTSLAIVAANLIAIPVISFIALPLVLVSTILIYLSTDLAQIFFDMALASLRCLWHYLEFIVAFAGKSIMFSSTQWFLFSAVCLVSLATSHIRYYVGTLLLTRVTCLITVVGLCLISSIMFFSVRETQQTSRDWQVYGLDVGQGLAVAVVKQNRVILYDTGASYPSGFNMVDSVIVPFLKFHGVTQVDYLFISHLDNDHAGGLKALRALKIPEKVVVNSSVVDERYPCVQGEKYKWQGLDIDVLWPVDAKATKNADSCVIKISDGQHSLLLTGDIPKSVEKTLVEKFQHSNMLDVNVMFAPHHGSNSSSSAEFLESTSSEVVIFSAGFLNRWRHPRNEVQKRYNLEGSESFSTAENGMLMVEFTDTGYHVYRYRQDLWPFWFAN